ncbi:MAG: DUF4339 domain-containing protein [Alphaproteobacteria bacterium]|nr:DUF4339 domain-containing protein [Alphaproteobacteria bacterium]
MAISPAPVPDSWFVSVDGKSYGPYTEEQVAGFVREGRVTPNTPVMRNRDPWMIASLHTQFAPLFPSRQPPPPPSDVSEKELAKVVIIAELRTGSSIAFEGAIAKLGSSYRLNHFVWLLHTNVPFSQIRKDLASHVGRNDPLFISDTTNRRTAWINFGPGAEATIKSLWRGALPGQ